MCALAAGLGTAVLTETASSLRFSLDDCRKDDSPVRELVAEAALRDGVEPRALFVRTLLHLPRVAARNGFFSLRQLNAELKASTTSLRKDQEAVAHLIPLNGFPLQDLKFVEYEDPDEPEAIFGRMHYLRSARPGSRNFALVDPINRLPVTLCSVSPLEWAVVGRQLHAQFGVSPARVWDVSRVYSFDIAPTNAISFMLAKVRNAIRQTDDVELLTTAVDPNLGFTGSSYRAANWHRWMSIRARPYLYVGGRYASPRQLRARFGTANLDDVRRQAVVEQSRAALLDSSIYCWRLRGKTEAVPVDAQRRLRR